MSAPMGAIIINGIQNHSNINELFRDFHPNIIKLFFLILKEKKKKKKKKELSKS